MAKPKLHDCGEAGMLTMNQISERNGAQWATVRARLQNGWTGAETLAGERVGYRSTEAHRWRTAKFRVRVLQYANERTGGGFMSVDRAPLAYDPWCQAAIADAYECGGYSLERTGEILGGITRERVRQIEEGAFRKIKRAIGKFGRDEILTLLRGIEHRSQDAFETEERIEHGDNRKRNTPRRPAKEAQS